MDMIKILTSITDLLDFWPGLKTKLATVAAFILAVIAAWNTAAPDLGVDFVIKVPEIVNALVLVLLGVGASNQPKRLLKK